MASKVKPVKWNTKKRMISMWVRESTLEAIGLLDKNEFPNRTFVFESPVERGLIKKGLLEAPPK